MRSASTAGFGLTLLSLAFPADLGAKANPALTPEHIKPEWYFFFQFRLLKLTSLSASVVVASWAVATPTSPSR